MTAASTNERTTSDYFTLPEVRLSGAIEFEPPKMANVKLVMDVGNGKIVGATIVPRDLGCRKFTGKVPSQMGGRIEVAGYRLMRLFTQSLHHSHSSVKTVASQQIIVLTPEQAQYRLNVAINTYNSTLKKSF
ncbi:hypothetical protein [Pseudomonas sp. TE3610]